MILKSPNSADNIRIADAQAFADKLRSLGIPAGELRINSMEAGGGGADYLPIAEVETNADEAYNVLVFVNGSWHNVAAMKRMMGGGSVVEFRRVASDCLMDEDSAVLNIPGAVKAIEKIIQKA